MREFSPRVMSPETAGACGADFGAFLSVATSISRMPPCDGAGKSCDSRCSPSTSAVAFTLSPAGTLSNCARPASSVFTLSTRPLAKCSSTRWLAMLLDSCPRIRRTEMLPSGRSVTGRGMPAICLGSGIWNCANANSPPQRTQSTQRDTLKTLCAHCVLCGGAFLCVLIASKLHTALVTKFRIEIPRRPALPTESRRLRFGRSVAEALGEVALDLRTVTAARVEQADQPRRARAKPARHLVEVAFGQLPHRLIEL